MSHAGDPPEPLGRSTARNLWRIIATVVLIVALLLLLGYCVARQRDTGDDTATRTPSAGAPVPHTSPTSSPRPASGKSGASSAGKQAGSGTGAGGAPGSQSAASPTPSRTTKSTSAAKGSSSRAGSGVTPRAAPNTGGGSAAGAPDLLMVLVGVLLILGSAVLGLFTARRWRRAW
jgi:hypothetical protein